MFGASLTLTRFENSGAVSVNLPDPRYLEAALQSISTGTPHLVTGYQGWRVTVDGPAGTKGATADQWGAVRQSAAWANNNSMMADQIIMALKNSGLLRNGNVVTTTTTINGVSYRMKVESGGVTCGVPCNNKAAVADATTHTYKNRFKMWRASDGKEALELLFDDVGDTSGGVLLAYRLAVISNGATSNNESLIVESFIAMAGGKRHQTYSWSNDFWISPDSRAATASDRGRVVLEEMTIGLKGGGMSNGLCVRIAARTVANFSAGSCGSGPFYYAVAYGQRTDGNFETAALSGFSNVSLATAATGLGTVCGVANYLKYGIFNGGGFIQDTLLAASVPSGYPDPSLNGGYPGVQTLFSHVADNQHTYDDLRQTTLDPMNVIFPNNGESMP
ncbi:MAG: hypothetical protein HY042_04730 [Spirochaetia bacterium]|nr:hypothetical protein [Spirochaetia bacterium]